MATLIKSKLHLLGEWIEIREEMLKKKVTSERDEIAVAVLNRKIHCNKFLIATTRKSWLL